MLQIFRRAKHCNHDVLNCFSFLKIDALDKDQKDLQVGYSYEIFWNSLPYLSAKKADRHIPDDKSERKSF